MDEFIVFFLTMAVALALHYFAMDRAWKKSIKYFDEKFKQLKEDKNN